MLKFVFIIGEIGSEAGRHFESLSITSRPYRMYGGQLTGLVNIFTPDVATIIIGVKKQNNLFNFILAV